MPWHAIGLGVEIALAAFLGIALVVWAVLFVAGIWDEFRDQAGRLAHAFWEFVTHQR